MKIRLLLTTVSAAALSLAVSCQSAKTVAGGTAGAVKGAAQGTGNLTKNAVKGTAGVAKTAAKTGVNFAP